MGRCLCCEDVELLTAPLVRCCLYPFVSCPTPAGSPVGFCSTSRVVTFDLCGLQPRNCSAHTTLRFLASFVEAIVEAPTLSTLTRGFAFIDLLAMIVGGGYSTSCLKEMRGVSFLQDGVCGWDSAAAAPLRLDGMGTPYWFHKFPLLGDRLISLVCVIHFGFSSCSECSTNAAR